jgi:2-isopropylmalate synthase
VRTPTRQSSEALIHDWNASEREVIASFELLDETLRDGLQSASVRQPRVDEKIELLSRMEALGVDVAKIGMPSSSSRMFDDAVAMARFAAGKGFRLRVACAARALPKDIERVADVALRAGTAVDLYFFAPSSELRVTAEGWDFGVARKLVSDAMASARSCGLVATFVAEDATRASPEALTELVRAAVGEGARRVCICDTAGYATPSGTRALVSFVRNVVSTPESPVGVDWHGHDDRGLALANALAAVEAGADRVHATALGVGERAGNVAVELLVMNALLLGAPCRWKPEELGAYCRVASHVLDRAIPKNHPLFGEDAFRTTTGTHAAAIVKAEERGDAWLADHVYSSVPAVRLGRKQEIGIGAMSGMANVVHWMRHHGMTPNEDLARAILARAKETDRALTDDDLWSAVRAYRAAKKSGSGDDDEPAPPRAPAS